MLRNYLRFALRNFRQRPGYPLLNGVGLTLGMAGTLVLFLFIHFHRQTDRHHALAGRIHRVVLDLHFDEGTVEPSAGTSLPMVEAFRRDYPSVEKVAFLKEIITPMVTVPAPNGGVARGFMEEGAVAFANEDYFGTFSYGWRLGNPATALDEPGTVVLTEQYARKYFGTLHAAGRTLALNGTPLRVTGVVADPPPATDLKKEVFVSLASLRLIDPGLDPNDFSWISGRHQLFLVLAEGASAKVLAGQLPAFSKKYFGSAAPAFRFGLQPLADVHFNPRYGGPTSRTLLGTLALIGLFLAGIACINFINLSTVQAFLRAKEVGVRQVLGSSRAQVFGQFMTETAVVVLAAGVVAAGLAYLLRPLLNNWFGTAIGADIFGTATFWGFWLALVVGVTGAAGGYPAWLLSGLRPALTLKAGRYTPGAKGATLRKVLVVAQFAIALVLIISTLVVTRQLRLFGRADMGFSRDAIVTVPLPAPAVTGREALRGQLQALPGVERVTFQYRPPASDSYMGGSVRFDNRTDWEQFAIRDRYADAQYLQTYGLKLVAGRNFIERDSLPEVVVNETFVRKLGLRSPEAVLGKAIEDGTSNTKGVIVGVVRDFHQQSLHMAIEPCAIFYLPSRMSQVGIKLQAASLESTLRQVEAQWRRSFPDAVFAYQFLDEQIARFYEKEKLTGRLVNLFSGLCIFIACLGLFGLAAFTARQRTKEIGIRKVLGATAGSIVALLSKDFLKLVGIAFGLAVPVAAYVMSRWLEDFAYRVPLGWTVFALAGAAALGIALLTVSVQALRAALANPVKSLRSE
jgi:putative ABC transport system permease protein